jgi:hypothetical protein
MSFIWQAVSVTLCVELVLLLLLVLPLPWGVRKNISRFLLQPKVRHSIDAALRYLGFGLAAALVDSVNALIKINEKFSSEDPAKAGGGDSSAGVIGRQDLKLRRAIAQRNLYLGGFALVLILTLTRLVTLVSNEMHLQAELKKLNGGKRVDEKGVPIDQKVGKTK